MEKRIIIEKLEKKSKLVEELLRNIGKINEIGLFSFIPRANQLDKKTYELIMPLNVYGKYAQEILHEISRAGYSFQIENTKNFNKKC